MPLLRHGLLMATGTVRFGSHTLPIAIPFNAVDGAWQILPNWICQCSTGPDRPTARVALA